VELIERDASCVLHNRVLAYLHRRRQDLLTPFLTPRRYRGRFGTGKLRVVLPITNRFFRWTPAQQTTFARGLEKTTHRRDPFRATSEMQHSIRVLAEMQAVEPKRLITLATKARPAVRHRAASADVRRRAGRATLLERSTISAPGLRSTLFVRTARAAARGGAGAVAGRVAAKVTVAKEVVRLVGELPSEVAFPVLQEFDGRKLHRDVRVA
jgi:hypothetical protein